jgi:phage shock protein A
LFPQKSDCHLPNRCQNLGQSIEQAEQKAENMQARAFTIEQFADIDTFDLSGSATGDSLGKQLLQLELEKAVEEQLSALKKCASD